MATTPDPPPLALPVRWRAWAAVRSPRLWRALGAVLLVTSALTAAYQAGPGACRARAAGRSDVRRAIVAGDDELLTAVADEYDLTVTELERVRIVERVGGRVVIELPPPDCWPGPIPG